MEKLVIKGGNPLKGEVKIQGAKNSVLPILAASILAEDLCIIENVPNISDVQNMLKILENLGATYEWENHTIKVDTSSVYKHEIDDRLMRTMRSSIFLLGSLVGRFNKAVVSHPGGCNLGTPRTTDLHEFGLKKLGAQFSEKGLSVTVPNRLVGSEIFLDYPSVGATENIMLTAVKADGTTIIKNPAREPEIVDLQMFLNRMGAKVSGAGTAEIKIVGVKKLHGCQHRIISDRIVTGTVMMAAVITQGDILLKDVIPEHSEPLIEKIREMGAKVTVFGNEIRVQGPEVLNPVDMIRTAPYPAFPTDMQAIIMIGLSMSQGTSYIVETVFQSRFKHVGEFRRMGAKITTIDKTAIVKGVNKLVGTYVEATDLRAGAALVLGGLAGENTTVVENIYHIDRGYEDIEGLFTSLGGNIKRITE